MKQIDTCNGPFLVWDQDQVGAVLGGRQFWDWQLLPAIDEAFRLRPASTALDLGAAFGWFTVYLAQRFKDVIAVEMHAGTVELLKSNLALHGLTNVLVCWGAAYDSQAPLALASAETIGWPVPVDLDQTPNPCSIALVPAELGQIFAPSLVMDDLIPASTDVGFIKVDVQGCDLRALKGLSKTIERCRPIICFEYESGPSSWHGDHWDAYLKFFEERRYLVTQLASPMDFVAHPL